MNIMVTEAQLKRVTKRLLEEGCNPEGEQDKKKKD